MAYKVTPHKAPVYEDHEMGSSSSVQPTINDGATVDDSTSDQENVNEQLLKELDKVYSPVVRLMKLFGLFMGDTKLKRLPNASGRCKGWVYLQRIYCVLFLVYGCCLLCAL